MSRLQPRPLRAFRPCFALLVGAAGCVTNQADLGDSNAPAFASTPPPGSATATQGLWKVVSNEQILGGFSVQSGKLIWFAGTGDPEWKMVDRVLRRHCSVENCAGTINSMTFPQTWTNSQEVLPWVVTSDGQYFYAQSRSPFDRPIATEPYVYSCGVNDPTKLGVPNHSLAKGVMADGMLYGCPTLATVAACRAADCDATIQDITPSMPADSDPSISPCPRAYADGYLYATSASKVFRFKPESAATAEVLYTGHTEEMFEFTANSSEMFWVEFFGETAALKACPATGCVAEPRVLLRDLQLTNGLLADEQNVYVLETEISGGPDTDNPVIAPQGNKITRVPISGTEAPTVLVEGVGPLGPMVMSDKLIYFRGSNRGVEQAAGIRRAWATRYIAAIPK